VHCTNLIRFLKLGRECRAPLCLASTKFAAATMGDFTAPAARSASNGGCTSSMCLAYAIPHSIAGPTGRALPTKFFMTIIFLSSGRFFYPFALWDFTFGVVLLIAYYRLMLADVARRP
jgi:hypothetical protein